LPDRQTYHHDGNGEFDADYNQLAIGDENPNPAFDSAHGISCPLASEIVWGADALLAIG
jgi:hypothetical protein